MGGLAAKAIAAVQRYRQQAISLLLYQAVLVTPLGQAFLRLLDALCREDATDCIMAYGHWFHTQAAARQPWSAHVVAEILRADNPFSQQAQHHPLEALPPALVQAAGRDLQRLQILSSCDGETLGRWVQTVCQLPEMPVVWQGQGEAIQGPFPALGNWQESLGALAQYYRQRGVGILGEYQAFYWQGGALVGIAHPDPVRLHQLAAYDVPQQQLIRNTEVLLAGYPALHVLLYGSRGSGKSSLVKALLNTYGDRGLRLIQVDKTQLHHLPAIVERVRHAPQKFILFVDDLSFETDDDAFKALKVVLEGDLTARPQNVVVYATSNRRHLVREYFSERPRPQDQEEVQAWDTLQEKLSFSDRFGLTLTFEPADQKTYLAIVKHLAGLAEIPLAITDLEARALQWATRHNGRSGRTARQFVDFLVADLALSPREPR